MIILHVSDFTFTPHSLRWLVNEAPKHHLLAVSGNVFPSDIAESEHAAWMEWLTEEGLLEYRRPVAFCGARTESVWARTRAWRPSAWWRRHRPRPAPNHLWSAGDQFVMGGLSFHVLGRGGLATAGAADIWIAHDTSANDGADLTAAILRHRPKYVLCGGVDDPRQWCAQIGSATVLNPGRSTSGPFPPHILIDTRRGDVRRVIDVPLNEERRDFDTAQRTPARRKTINPVLA